MKRLLEFLWLTPSDRRLLVSAALLLGVIRLGLSLLPFQTLRGLVSCVAQALTGLRKADQPSSDRVAWAVGVASRYVLKATCLTQALAVQALLEREGYPACLRVSVARGEERELKGHAWVESEGKVVVGGLELERYTPLPALDGERP